MCRIFLINIRSGYNLFWVALIFCLIMSVIQSCNVRTKIKDGETAFERKQYSVAVSLLEEELSESAPDNIKARKSFILAQSYMYLQEYKKAQDWFQYAAQKKYGAESLSGLARSSKYIEDYLTAIEAYRNLGASAARSQEVNREIQICEWALESKNKKSDYKISPLVINTMYSEYAPVLYEDNFLIFTSERPESTGKNSYLWTGQKFSDLFIMPKNGSEVRKFDSQINSLHNDGTAWFSKQMDRMYFTRCFNDSESSDHYCQLMSARREEGIWGEPEKMPFIEQNINYGHPTLIENDSVLVFSSDMEDPGGPRNLFYSILMADASWTYPEKMPSQINSMGNEVFPTGDGDTLYFSSDFWTGHGGFDIFKTYLKSDGSWSKPENMGYPINSGADDFSFIVDYSARPRLNVVQQGYFVSSRSGRGKDDLYLFNKIKRVHDSIPSIVKEDKRLLYVTVKTLTPEFVVRDDPNSGQSGKRPLGKTQIKIEDLTGKNITSGISDLNGFYYSLLPINTSVRVIASKQDYLNASLVVKSENIVFAENETSKTINTELILDKIYLNTEIILNNIYYDYDKWDIKQDAMPTLDSLVKLLNDNPEIHIELGSHTDCRGSEEYNIELSQKRAQSVMNYLADAGIEESRLMARGFGESRLVDNCQCETCSEQQHQKNRRTTFSIVKK